MVSDSPCVSVSLSEERGDEKQRHLMRRFEGGLFSAVVYEQQSWGETIDERDVKQGRGRPRKEYLVRWKRPRIPGCRLTTPGLVESWKTKKAFKGGR